MHEVKRYHCDHCTKVLSKKSDMVKHERRCPRNPESRSCGTCLYLTYKILRGDSATPDTAVSICELGQFDPARKTKRNPYGLRSNCPYYVVDPYRFN